MEINRNKIDLLNDLVVEYVSKLNKKSSFVDEFEYFDYQEKRFNVPKIGVFTSNLLFFLSKLKKPKSVLEIGFGSGYSAYSIYKGCNSFERFISLERDPYRFERGKEFLTNKNINIELYNYDFFALYKKLDLYNKEFFDKTITPQVLKNVSISLPNKFDFIFVDGVKRHYYDIFSILKNSIASGGIIVFDNILFGGKVVSLYGDNVKKYVSGTDLLNRFNHETYLDNDFDFIYINQDDGLAIGMKK